MNVLTLNDRPEKLEECLQLITSAFNYPNEFSYREDFALLTQTQNHQNCYFIEEDSKVVATLFTLPRELVYKDAALPVLFLGGISVRDENRGGGLFRSLLETVILLNSHNALFLLWSDLSSLYEKFSFHEFGLVQEVEEAGLSIEELTPGSKTIKSQLQESYETLGRQCLIPRRSEQDWDILLSSSSIRYLQDSSGSSYFVGKGFDLQGICHEFHPFDSKDKPRVPKYWDYEPSESAESLRYMGFLRLGNLEVLNELIEYSSQGRLKILERSEGLIKVRFDSENFELSDRDFIQGLWGPGKITEWIDLVPQIRILGFDSV